MAEGYAKTYTDSSLSISSGGVEAHGLNPRAVEAMKEVGIDISDQESTIISDSDIQHYDLVITLCNSARDRCPNVELLSEHIHWGIEDPAHYNNDKDYLKHFRRIRDDIGNRVKDLINKKEKIGI